MLAYKEVHHLSDWFYYQLIRRAAQQVAPKADNYARYTLYKWFFLTRSGYDATLVVSNKKLKFYVRSDENIYDIPYYMKDGNQYVCLNMHDYEDFYNDSDSAGQVILSVPDAANAFSYKVTAMPEFKADAYSEKEVRFSYHNKDYSFKIKFTPQVQTIFNNYPVVDFASYFNIPLSKETYNSLIPALKEDVAAMEQQRGIDFLMRFTRNAFRYEADQKVFGKERRFAPEQTLMNDYSDCDDRAALFFYLVKEVYDLPMIVLVYPSHVTVAVKMDRPAKGTTIEYNGAKYTVCEATPQWQDLRIGQLPSDLRRQSYEVVYAYQPSQSN
jgi:hypothetical protein